VPFPSSFDSTGNMSGMVDATEAAGASVQANRNPTEFLKSVLGKPVQVPPSLSTSPRIQHTHSLTHPPTTHACR
jgi:hypothetical protein